MSDYDIYFKEINYIRLLFVEVVEGLRKERPEGSIKST